MSTKSYEAWAAFDVERELEQVDERAQREEQRRALEQQQRAKQRVEDTVSANAEQSAHMLAAHAAVAALKAKAKVKARNTQSDTHAAVCDANTTAMSSTASDAASRSNQVETSSDETAMSRLQRHSTLFATKHELIKRIMERRREGDAALQRANASSANDAAADLQRALAAFESALAAATSLETIVPDVLAVESELRDGDGQSRPPESSAPSDKPSTTQTGDHNHDHRHAHGESCTADHSKCSHIGDPHTPERKTPTAVAAPTLPQPDDLAAIVTMFVKDVYMGIGACFAQQQRFAAATDAFKHVLLRDDTHVAAWLARGRAFERMGAALLAMLHFNRATQLDATNEDATACLERVKTVLHSDMDDTLDSTAVARSVESLTRSSSSTPLLLSTLESIHALFLEANVLMLEGFFQYAIPKYEIVLGCIDACEQQLYTEADIELDRDVTQAVLASLAQIRASCRLNIASGYYEMHKCLSVGVEHCEAVLAEGASDIAGVAADAVRATCHFRIGQLLCAAHMYKRAIEHLSTARALVAASSSCSERDERLAKVEKEIDRCAFERSQHDLPYIRSLLAETNGPTTHK